MKENTPVANKQPTGSEPMHDQIAQRAYEISLPTAPPTGGMAKTGCVLKASCVWRRPGRHAT